MVYQVFVSSALVRCLEVAFFSVIVAFPGHFDIGCSPISTKFMEQSATHLTRTLESWLFGMLHVQLSAALFLVSVEEDWTSRYLH